ncbi:MAG TPA: cell division protein ZapB [Rhodanobacteraceae bacterium]|nr:cell division protein ZapB [Rhodanobacteraceae bacterium]
MASTIFHHWVDQLNALPGSRRRWILGGLAAIAVAVAFGLGALFGRGVGFPNGLEARVHRLATRNAALESENQSLKAQQQTASTTVAALKQAMASRDAEMQTLRQEQAFYARLIGIDGDRSGLGVHSIVLTPVKGTDAWNFTITLVNTAENADAARGKLTVAVEGVSEGKLATLDWAHLSGASGKGGIPFAFKFFQQLQGSLALPKGFVPNRIAITLHPDGGSAITRKLDWGDALAGRHGITITTP